MLKLFQINLFQNLNKFQIIKPISHFQNFSISNSNPLSSSQFSLENQPNEPTLRFSHPWPEWMDLMELLSKRGYFENPFTITAEFGGKHVNLVRTASLNFARDRSLLIRYLSRKDIQVIVGYGCPSLDRKVVNSGKRLRSHVGINEVNVCSSCNLRGDCDRAYVQARHDDSGRTVDVMRILLTYGLDSQDGISQNKIVEDSVRRLLKDMVEYGIQIDSDLPNGSLPKSASSQVRDHPSIKVPMKECDWICRKCNFVNFSRNIKCLRCNDWSEERLRQLKEDQDHLPLKKGDWICERCNYLNFARNTRCLQCEENPPKRHLNPGEWECESCNYINFRKNIACLKCDHKRPKALKASNKTTQPENEGRNRINRSVSRFSFGDFETNENKRVELSSSSNQSKGATMWSFVDEEREDNDLVSQSEDSGFMDFPIKGGKSSLSQNSEKRKVWMEDMVKKSKKSARTIERDDDKWKDAKLQRRLEDVESPPGDDDLSEWFREKNHSKIKDSI